MSQVNITSHGENVSLKYFLDGKDTSLDERIRNFYEYSGTLTRMGKLLYRRQITSKADREVNIIDQVSGKEKKMLMFGSNNYLGLASHPHVINKVKETIDVFGVGIGGPPLLNGNTSLHLELEQGLSQLKHTESTLLFSSGFNANMGWVLALLGEKDVIFFDQYNHSSLYTGLQQIKCKKIPFRHNSINDLKNKLERYAAGYENRWLVVEGVYSMDGDLSPLDEIAQISKEYNCKLVVDDAHGTGVIGQSGSGTPDHFGVSKDVYLHIGTFSKSFAATGGFISGAKDVIDYLRFMCAQYMFSASMPPTVIATVLGGLDVMASEKHLQLQLHKNVKYLLAEFKKIGIETNSESGIIPVIIPEDKSIRDIALKFHNKGIFLNSIEYPAVPKDKQRMRVSMMATHTKQDIDILVKVFEEIFKEEGII